LMARAAAVVLFPACREHKSKSRSVEERKRFACHWSGSIFAWRRMWAGSVRALSRTGLAAGVRWATAALNFATSFIRVAVLMVIHLCQLSFQFLDRAGQVQQGQRVVAD